MTVNGGQRTLEIGVSAVAIALARAPRRAVLFAHKAPI
jgi:hypothetical protein